MREIVLKPFIDDYYGINVLSVNEVIEWLTFLKLKEREKSNASSNQTHSRLGCNRTPERCHRLTFQEGIFLGECFVFLSRLYFVQDVLT